MFVKMLNNNLTQFDQTYKEGQNDDKNGLGIHYVEDSEALLFLSYKTTNLTTGEKIVNNSEYYSVVVDFEDYTQTKLFGNSDIPVLSTQCLYLSKIQKIDDDFIISLINSFGHYDNKEVVFTVLLGLQRNNRERFYPLIWSKIKQYWWGKGMMKHFGHKGV